MERTTTANSRESQQLVVMTYKIQKNEFEILLFEDNILKRSHQYRGVIVHSA
jgi:hypothetical protein